MVGVEVAFRSVLLGSTTFSGDETMLALAVSFRLLTSDIFSGRLGFGALGMHFSGGATVSEDT